MVVALVGIGLAVVALAVSSASAVFVHRQVKVADRQRQRDFEATVVAELLNFERNGDLLRYEIAVTNAGPAVARDVDIAFVEWSDANAFGRALATADVSPALLRGERRTVVVELPATDARFDDRHVSIELNADYYDDNGVRNERLALLFDDSFVLTPPQPPTRA